MRVAESIRIKLERALNPSRLAIEDQSRRHAGHAGARPEGESHFAIEVVSAAFAGTSRIARQRMIHDLLRIELETGLHALSLRALTPEEDAARGRPPSRREGAHEPV